MDNRANEEVNATYCNQKHAPSIVKAKNPL